MYRPRCHAPLITVALLSALLLAAAAVGQGPPASDVLYQTSTLDALMAGVYDGDVSFGELKRHGDFGLGTLNALDGEMLAFDGRFYQVTVEGKVHRIPDWARTPFACVTSFRGRHRAARAEDDGAERASRAD